MNTNLPKIFDQMSRSFIGFDDLFDLAASRFNSPAPTYPHYNLIKKSDDEYQLELAVAGYSEDEITVTTQHDMLTVKGSKKEESTSNYIFKGISSREFVRSWRLDTYFEVKGAEIKNGILTIELVRNVPEQEKPKTIEIKRS